MKTRDAGSPEISERMHPLEAGRSETCKSPYCFSGAFDGMQRLCESVRFPIRTRSHRKTLTREPISVYRPRELAKLTGPGRTASSRRPGTARESVLLQKNSSESSRATTSGNGCRAAAGVRPNKQWLPGQKAADPELRSDCRGLRYREGVEGTSRPKSPMLILRAESATTLSTFPNPLCRLCPCISQRAVSDSSRTSGSQGRAPARFRAVASR